MATNLSDSYLQLCYETGRHTKWRHFIFWYVSLWQYSWCCLRVIWSTTAVKNFVAVEHWLIIAAYMDHNFILIHMKWIYKMLTRHFVLLRDINNLVKFTKIILVLKLIILWIECSSSLVIIQILEMFKIFKLNINSL